jgi:hypothetical protein
VRERGGAEERGRGGAEGDDYSDAGRGGWDGVIDEEAHMGLYDDEGDYDELEPGMPSTFPAAPYVPVPAPPGFDANDDNLEELVEWDVEEAEWFSKPVPVGDMSAEDARPTAGGAAAAGREGPQAHDGYQGPAFIADWAVDDTAHLDYDDEDGE